MTATSPSKSSAVAAISKALADPADQVRASAMASIAERTAATLR